MDSAYLPCLDRIRHANADIRSLKRAFRAYIADDAYKLETQLDIHDPTKIENPLRQSFGQSLLAGSKLATVSPSH